MQAEVYEFLVYMSFCQSYLLWDDHTMTAAKSWTPAEMPCLLGKVAIVTGAKYVHSDAS